MLSAVFREQCEELRSVQSRRREQQVCLDRAAQVRDRQVQQQQLQQEERLFQQLWEADRRAKDKQESLRLQRRRQGDAEQLHFLRSQMEEAERQRQQETELREEEARLLVCSSLCS